MSLAEELLGGWAPIFRTFDLKSGSQGRFEVTLDGELIFSKKQLDRFPHPGEVAAIFETKLGRRPQWRKTKH